MSEYLEFDDPDRYVGDNLSWDGFVEWMGANEAQRAMAVLAYPVDGNDRRIYLTALVLDTKCDFSSASGGC